VRQKTIQDLRLHDLLGCKRDMLDILGLNKS
jgi:hypothetical protein